MAKSRPSTKSQVAAPSQASARQETIKQSEDDGQPPGTDRKQADHSGKSGKPAKKGSEEAAADKNEVKAKSPVPLIPDKKGDVQQVARTQRHLELIDKFEQHFPHCFAITNRFTLYSDSTAQIKNCEQAVKAAAEGVLSDYDKLQAQV